MFTLLALIIVLFSVQPDVVDAMTLQTSENAERRPAQHFDGPTHCPIAQTRHEIHIRSLSLMAAGDGGGLPRLSHQHTCSNGHDCVARTIRTSLSVEQSAWEHILRCKATVLQDPAVVAVSFIHVLADKAALCQSE